MTPALKAATSVLVDTMALDNRFRKIPRAASGCSCILQAILTLCLLTAIPGMLPAQAGQIRALQGHVPPAAARLQPLGRLPGTNSLHLAISLPFRNAEGLTNLLRQLYDPASPSFHRFLNPRQFSDAFGPTAQDYQAVITFANSNGLSIIATASNRALLELRAPVSAVEMAFHVHLQTFRHPTESRSFYAPDVEPSVDSDVPILFIAGLNDYLIPHPASLHVAPAGQSPNLTPSNTGGSQGGYYVGQDFRNAYVPGVTNMGTGQCVALVEFDSYYPADIADYLALPSAGLSGSSVNLSNVVLGLTGNPGSGNVEVALDIDMAISMAPGLSTICVYEGTNDSAAPDVVLNRILSDDSSRQISCSWTGFNDAAVENDLLQFGVQGQSFFQASGDSGAYTSTFHPNHNPVAVPTDNTNITVVGGTTLNTTNGSWMSESTWSWFTQPLGTLSNDATSGGVSPTWKIPAWQQGISMSSNQGSTSARNLPDVAMNANNLYLYGDDGSQLTGGGTSAAAPLWAGFAALINQQRAAQAQPPMGFMNPALYAIGKGASYNSCFHDITVGNNTNLSSTSRFSAVAGYDLCTGWGTPNGANLLATLAPEPLQITPSAGFVSTGPYGGPFSVTSQSCTLTNVATSSFNWSLTNSSPWLSASVSGGTLVSGGAAATVNISLNSAASNLTAGVYTNTIWFTNLNDTVAQSRQFVLTVSQVTPGLIWAAPASITYGTPLSAAQLNAATGVPGAFAYNPAIGAVLGAATNTLSVIFTPNDPVDYNSVTGTVNLVVSPAPLTVTAANAARPYGQPNPLFQGVITGLQNEDPITASYSCGAGTGSGVGNYPIVPSLNDPADLETNYSVSLVNGTLTIYQAAVAITWANPAPINYGTALSAAQLNATANVPGTFAYNPGAGTVLNAGTNTLSVSFTPADNLDYSNATGTVNLVVNPPITGDIAGEPLLPAWGLPAMLAGLLITGLRFLARPAASPNLNGKV